MAQKRNIIGKKTAKLRAEGLIPAVLYGWGEKESRLIAVSAKDFLKIWREAGESSIIDLEVDGTKKSVLIQDIAIDPVRDLPLHADFYAVQMDKPIEVTIPVSFIGESLAVKNLGATLVKVVHELRVEALPKDLPHEIVIDLSILVEIGSRIMVRDLQLAAGVKPVADPEEVIVVVQAHTEEEALATERTLEDIEVEAKGKKPEEGEEGTEAVAAKATK